MHLEFKTIEDLVSIAEKAKAIDQEVLSVIEKKGKELGFIVERTNIPDQLKIIENTYLIDQANSAKSELMIYVEGIKSWRKKELELLGITEIIMI